MVSLVAELADRAVGRMVPCRMIEATVRSRSVMLATLPQLIPIFAYLGLGMVLRARGLADRAHGDFLLRFVFFVTLPALVLTTVSTIQFTPEHALLRVVPCPRRARRRRSSCLIRSPGCGNDLIKTCRRRCGAVSG